MALTTNPTPPPSGGNGLETLPNNPVGAPLFEVHHLALPSCCPVSKNPFPGSTVTIYYRVKEEVLEIASLVRYIHQFVGGYYDQTGTLIVRDMEGMILRIAQDCATVLGVPVRVKAQLVLRPRQEMTIKARGYPTSIDNGR